MCLKRNAIFPSLFKIGNLRETGHDSISGHVIFCHDDLRKLKSLRDWFFSLIVTPFMATPRCGPPAFLFSDCSVCSKAYTPGLNFICQKCSDGTNGIAFTVVIIVLVIAFGLEIFSYLVSAEVGGAGRGIVDRVTRWVPIQSIKIIVVAWQILTQ